MSTTPLPTAPAFQRQRLRFRKEGDLRWISHRDLVRTIERLCRRADLKLRMSEGFHPKPKLSFPSALSLGIEGQEEILELELTTPVEPQQLQQQLNDLAPPGLSFTHVERVEPGRRKPRVRSMQYQFPVPHELQQQVRRAIDKMLAATELLVQRDSRPQPINIRADLDSVTLLDGVLVFRLRASGQASARPRDVLQELGLADLEQQGQFLTRSEVEVIS